MTKRLIVRRSWDLLQGCSDFLQNLLYQPKPDYLFLSPLSVFQDGSSL